MIYLADFALEAGFPESVLNGTLGYGYEGGNVLALHHGVAKVGFTGSTQTGRRIAEASIWNLKKVSLELGGKAANIIFEDAHLESTISGSFWANFGNSGQSCTAGSRLYVHSRIHEKLTEGLVNTE